MPFNFRLKSVLRVRRLQEDIAKNRLAEANRALRFAVTDRDNRIDHFSELGVPSGMRTYDEFVRETQVMNLAAESVGFGEKRVGEATLYTDHRRTEFLGAHQKVQALEKLENRQRAEFNLKEDRQEVTRVDDLVTTRFARDMAVAASAESARRGAPS